MFTFSEKFVQAVVVSIVSSDAWVVVFKSAATFASSAGVLLLVEGSGFAVVVAADVVVAVVVVVVMVVVTAEVSSGDRDVVCGAGVVLWATSVDVLGTGSVKTSPWTMVSCASSFSEASLIELAISLDIVYANEEMRFCSGGANPMKGYVLAGNS
jgi:hypothetical protein